MNKEQLIEQLKSRFGDKITGANLENVDPWVEVASAALIEVCKFLRDDASTQLNYLNSICVVDYLEPDAKKASKLTRPACLEVVYHLSSLTKKTTFVVKVVLPRWKDDNAGVLPEVPSLVSLWPTADWHEREAYDLSGVQFIGHPGLTRILCPEDWEGHPLRKDYVMPLEYHGIRGR